VLLDGCHAPDIETLTGRTRGAFFKAAPSWYPIPAPWPRWRQALKTTRDCPTSRQHSPDARKPIAEIYEAGSEPSRPPPNS
jgi:hypothetical protein